MSGFGGASTGAGAGGAAAAAAGPEVHMWLWSRVSQRQVTNPTKLSLLAMGLSFAKFLELVFATENFKQFIWFFAVPSSSFCVCVVFGLRSSIAAVLVCGVFVV